MEPVCAVHCHIGEPRRMSRSFSASLTTSLHLGALAAAGALLVPCAQAAPASEKGGTAIAPAGPERVNPGERLSDWLLRQPENAANPGLSWQVPQEQLAGQFLKNTLLVQIEGLILRTNAENERASHQRLLSWLRGLPATGRVALGIVDGRWLQANPNEDPVLAAEQRIVPSTAPLHLVAVVQPDGTLCQVEHEPGRNVLDYLSACGLLGQADWAWVAQPDGRTAHAGVAAWNASPTDEPAPGAWIWAAPRSMPQLAEMSEGMIKFLATQGPSPQDPAATSAMPDAREAPATSPGFAAAPPSPAHVVSGQLPERVAAQPRPLEISGNDWGETGLLQTPSARMNEAGHMRMSLSNVYPYSRLTFMFQPFDWLEAGFRYTSISNVAYGVSTTGQSTKDKSIDLKVRLLKESAYVPEVALGFRDIGGTGLFSSEYLVASKRWHDLDFSLGIGWGYLGASGNLRNPFRLLGSRFATRPAARSDGSANFNSFFRGPAAIFGGVQWRTPWEPLTLKLEYDGNNYQHEPFNNDQRRRSPINVGLNYKVSSNVTLSAGYERGDKFMLGLTLNTNPAKAQTTKVADRPLPNFTPGAPEHSPGWAETAAEIEAQTEWQVTRIAPKGNVLHVWVTESNTVYRSARVEKAIAVLHHTAPNMIGSFVFHYSERGLPMHAQVVDRTEWVAARIQARPPHLARTPAVRNYEPASYDDLVRLEQATTAAATANPSAPQQNNSATPAQTPVQGPWQRHRDKFSFGLAPSFGQIVGGPDAFIMYQLGIQATGEYRFNDRTWLSGNVNLRLVDNYDKFTYTAPSNLPRVRTFQREYVTTSRFTIPSLQITHVGQLSRNQYYSVYGGLLEPMFAGVGAEWLYRPWGSRVAFGIDINRVQQRGFRQNFSLRDYKVTTGHASLYWDTGWHGVMARLSVGQYLAGDRGVTVDVMRRFSNGFVVGAYATKTNVSRAEFGEGGFDKGIYVSIPLDALLPRSSKFSLGFLWTPLTRDGGARLSRNYPLYELTSGRDPTAFDFGPPKANAPRAGDNILDFGSNK